MKKSIFCLARDQGHAQRIINELINNDFLEKDISVLMADNQQKFSKNLGHEKKTKTGEAAAAGGLAGGIVGGFIGLLAGLGAIVIPGLGPFLAVGPIMGALSGSGVGGGVGLLIGSLIGLGMPEYVAKRYEDRLKEGKILIAVHTEAVEDENSAKALFEREDAEDISCLSEQAESRENSLMK